MIYLSKVGDDHGCCIDVYLRCHDYFSPLEKVITRMTNGGAGCFERRLPLFLSMQVVGGHSGLLHQNIFDRKEAINEWQMSKT